VMNAFGDATMALAFFVLIWQTGTLDFEGVFAGAGDLSQTLVNLVALGLLGGAVAKSAQLPLHTWLPDAMEGPTPVSALIHAATMVTAGVYLIVRAHPIFELAPSISDLAAGLGAITLLLAGLVALVQTDIKKVIAYSTMSQIGYMFLGAGLGAYGSGMFHLMTHAFFKALLFLAAGVVIHHLANEQDIRLMGGVRHSLPKTFIAFLVGSLALVGIPPFAGFFSKDAILASAWASGGYGQLLFVAGLAGALLTGLYTFRLLFIVFLGAPSPLVQEHEHGHGRREGPWTMTWVVGLLTVLTFIGGWIDVAGLWHTFGGWLDPVAVGRDHLALVEPTVTEDYVTSVLAVGLGLLGTAIAWVLYGARSRPVPRWAFLQRTLEHKFWFDELYDAIFYKPAVFLAALFRRGVEEPLIGGSITGISVGAREAGDALGEVQTGYLRSYALAIAGAAAVLVVVFISVR
jgi:NADH-quinone oxidoreductase subunit L